MPKERAGGGTGPAPPLRRAEPGSTSLTELARARTEERLSDKKLLGPYKPEVEQALADSPRLVAGIGGLFKKSGLSGYEPALAKLTEQMQAYDRWVTAVILPRARAPTAGFPRSSTPPTSTSSAWTCPPRPSSGRR